ncbi:hypothetical protein CKO11_10145 [Rhodobacter sp. TJ_12]|uniref:YdcF family protein n=1 Tax=Rhodobacter sp. TJ_12 TaxID=2029399 RepID=UPI001CBC1CC3|nr:YdcF family protein [Rhodobacter sp. TJ_12]MBZ4022820.1 hypothetical protein [Rhodobacter sp. TJ_12]
MTPRIALVLGARVAPDGTPSAALRRRVAHAISLYQAGQVGRLILSGGAFDGAPAEATVMADLCRAAGLPAAALIQEPKARNTRENFTCARPLLGAETALVVVTDRYHARRARLAAGGLGLSLRLSCPPAPDLAWHQYLKLAAREAVASLWYALRYGLSWGLLGRFSGSR